MVFADRGGRSPGGHPGYSWHPPTPPPIAPLSGSKPGSARQQAGLRRSLSRRLLPFLCQMLLHRLGSDNSSVSSAHAPKCTPRRLLKNPRMPRCCQFSEDRKEPSAGLMGCGVPISPQSRGATDQLGDIARAENWRNLGGTKGSHPFLGVSSLGHHGRVRGPSPFRRCSLVPPPISAPKISRVTCAGFSTVT